MLLEANHRPHYGLLSIVEEERLAFVADRDVAHSSVVLLAVEICEMACLLELQVLDGAYCCLVQRALKTAVLDGHATSRFGELQLSE